MVAWSSPVTSFLPSGVGQRIGSPDGGRATIAIESVSQKTYVPPASVTNRSSSASINRAAAVIVAAIGGNVYGPGSSG